MTSDANLLYFCNCCGIRVRDEDIDSGAARAYAVNCVYCVRCTENGDAVEPVQHYLKATDTSVLLQQVEMTEPMLAEAPRVHWPTPVTIEEAARQELAAMNRLIEANRKREVRKRNAILCTIGLAAAVAMLCAVPFLFSSKETPNKPSVTSRP